MFGICKFISNLNKNIKYQRILNQAYEQDQIIAKLSTMIGAQFYKDWIGRLYAVVNPAIKDGKFDQSQIFEYTEQGYDTTEHMQQWIVERLTMMEGFIQTNNLFDVLSYKLEKLDDNGNYLFIIFPVTLPPVLKYAKWSFFELLGIGTVALGYVIL